jgi:ribosomal peptide maturation radical SAM protein 1
MRICLVSMPWQSVKLPSLPVALLHARLAEIRPCDTVAEYHGYLRWAEFLLESSSGAVTPADYMSVADDGVFHGLGDWVFSGVLYGDPRWRAGVLDDYARRYGVAIEVVRRARSHAERFVEIAVDEILATEPEVVGFTSTFMQNVPSLATARRLKERAPHVIVVMGGGNCDGSMGHVMHRNHPFVDYVVRGEGELAFPELLGCVEAGVRPVDVPGVCWWRGEESVANPQSPRAVPPDVIPRPDFDGWQRALDASGMADHLEPELVLEGARGCWWGEKHHCTFCGLNGSSIEFRSRPAERMWSDIQYLVARHRILDIIMVDNIIDMAYFRDLLPRLAEADWDLRIHYEVKANLQPEQVELLAAAGVTCVQPGIESLSRRVLDLMDKGTTGAINLRTLRECEDRGITASWNYLYGFPGENAGDYDPIIDQLPALVHLQPPGSVSRLLLERFSPYFDRPELGFRERRPAEMYDHVYDLPERELHDMVYFFDSPPQGIGVGTAKRLHEAVERWQRDYPVSRLLVRDGSGDALVIEDSRVGRPQREHVLTGWRAAAYRALERGRDQRSLVQALAAAGHEQTPAGVEDWLAEQVAYGLLFVDDGVHVALATRGAPRKTGDRLLESLKIFPHVRLPFTFPWWRFENEPVPARPAPSVPRVQA